MAFQSPGTAKCSARALLPHKFNVSFVAAYSSAGRIPGSSPRIVDRTSCQGSEPHDTRARNIKLVMRFAGGHCGCSTGVRMSVRLTRRRCRTVGYVPHWHGHREHLCRASPAPARFGGRSEKSVANRPSVALAYEVLPNPSLEARPNIKTPGPRSGLAHFPPRGPGVLLSVPPQLER